MLTITFVGQVTESNNEEKIQTGKLITNPRENETVELDFSYYVSQDNKLEVLKTYLVIGDLYLYENKYCVQVESVLEVNTPVLSVLNAALLAKVHGGKNEPTKLIDMKGKRVLQIQMVNRTPVKENSNWLNVLVYNEKLHQYLDKLQNGNPFYVKGNLMFGEYSNKDGVTVKTLSMMLNKFEFVNSGGSNSDNDKTTKTNYNKANNTNPSSTDEIPF